MTIPDPFDIRRLCETVAASRGRPIDLCPMVMPPESPSGVWIATAERDYIFYEQDTTALHQEHIIAHELGHLLDEQRTETTDLAGLVLPNLDRRLIERVLHRTAYSVDQERVAETIASMILEKANRWKPVSEWDGPPGAAALRDRISRTIETSQDRWA